MADSNKSLSYTGRDQVDIRRELVSMVPELTDKWRDFSPSDLGMIILELIAGSQDLQNFYLDNQAFESFVDLAQQDKNIRSHLRAMNYRIPFMGSAKGEIYLYFSQPQEMSITIPKYTQLICDDNDLRYAVTDTTIVFTTEQVTVEGNKYYGLYKANTSLQVKEGIVRSFTLTRKQLASQTTSDGSVSRRIYLEGGDSHNYSDKSLWIDHRVAHQEDTDEVTREWIEVDDAIVEYNGGALYSVHQDSYGEVYMLMSVDFMDYIKDADTITVYWLQTLGEDGIAVPGESSQIKRFVSFAPENGDVYIEQREPTSGAYSIPDLSTLKPIARRQAQNIGRYITIDDFKNGVASEPYVFRYVCKDWKSPHYVSLPYQVKIWAVNFEGTDLNNQDIETLKTKFYEKGTTDIEIVYMLTDFIKIRFDVTLVLKTSTEANQALLRDEVKAYIENEYQYKNLEYGQKISLALLDSKIRALSSYIKSSEITLHQGRTYLITKYPEYTSSGISSIVITADMTNEVKEEKVDQVRSLITLDNYELSNDYNLSTLSDISELKIIQWEAVGDVVLDEIEFPEIYQINVSSTQEDSGVEI